jgi:hypothetical protein
VYIRRRAIVILPDDDVDLGDVETGIHTRCRPANAARP